MACSVSWGVSVACSMAIDEGICCVGILLPSLQMDGGPLDGCVLDLMHQGSMRGPLLQQSVLLFVGVAFLGASAPWDGALASMI